MLVSIEFFDKNNAQIKHIKVQDLSDLDFIEDDIQRRMNNRSIDKFMKDFRKMLLKIKKPPPNLYEIGKDVKNYLNFKLQTLMKPSN